METFVFLVGAAVILGGALGVVLSPNATRSALSLIATLFGIAVLFVAQEAHFLAAVQVIVYAGAIVVLFLFVLMLLGVDHVEALPDELDEARPRDGVGSARATEDLVQRLLGLLAERREAETADREHVVGLVGSREARCACGWQDDAREVHEDGRAARPEDDVLRGDVPVPQPLGLERLERPRDGRDEGQDLPCAPAGSQREHRPDARPLDARSHERGAVRIDLDDVEQRDEVGVADAREHLEPHERGPTRGDR